MKRFYIIFFLITGSVLALSATIIFSRYGVPAPTVKINSPTSSDPGYSVYSISPDALISRSDESSVPAFSLNAKAAAVGNLKTGLLLYGFNADARWPIASITKIMTAEIVLENMSKDSVITMMPADFSGGGSSLTANLEPGDKYSVSDLLKILLLPSSNEAAEAFARAYGRASFMSAMNAKAAAWGLKNTHFDDPSGISVANQSTAREFLELVRKVYAAHPEIFMITENRVATVKNLSTGLYKEFSSTNNFSGRSGFLGGKTGTTPEAGDNLVSIFATKNDPVVILVFAAIDRYAATESLLQLIR